MTDHPRLVPDSRLKYRVTFFLRPWTMQRRRTFDQNVLGGLDTGSEGYMEAVFETLEEARSIVSKSDLAIIATDEYDSKPGSRHWYGGVLLERSPALEALRAELLAAVRCGKGP